jgi:phosphoribosylformylglycinamidine synthase subunit PurS
MPVTVKIDVMLKDEILDPQGQALERSLPQLGFAGVDSVRVGKHIVMVVDDSEDLDSRVEDMASRLLANPVIETFTYRLEPGVSGAQAPGQR